METDCTHHQISMKDFNDWLKEDCHQPNPLVDFPRTDYCCYIDYKYMKDMFHGNPEIFSHVRWSSLGLSEFDGSDSTIWIGSEGANTPCHQDTYGFNLVTQIQGRKLWILFPPEDTQYLYPSRIPYEESSIFSAVNIRNPDLKRFPLLKNSHPVIVTLSPGQTLYVPHHWWHYVQSLEPSISVNVWVPVASDNESRYHEAITRALASSLIRDFTVIDGGDKDVYSLECWLNPTETLHDAVVNLDLLKTSLTHLLEDKEEERETCLLTDASAEKPTHNTERKSDSEVFFYLTKLASAMENFPLCKVSSPFEINCLKRKSSEKESSTKCTKKLKLSSADEISQSDELSVEYEEHGYCSKELFSIDCCSVNVYLKFMRDLCEKNSCSCQRNSRKRKLIFDSSLITPIGVQGQAGRDKSMESETIKCNSKIEEASCSSTFSVIKKELDHNTLSHQDETPKDQHTISFQSKDPKVYTHSTSSCAEINVGTLSCNERKMEDQHGQTLIKNRTGSLNQKLTHKEMSEAFLTSVLQPDIVLAVSVKVREQIKSLLRAKNKILCPF